MFVHLTHKIPRWAILDTIEDGPKAALGLVPVLGIVGLKTLAELLEEKTV